jgi:hypothetical protein
MKILSCSFANRLLFSLAFFSFFTLVFFNNLAFGESAPAAPVAPAVAPSAPVAQTVAKTEESPSPTTTGKFVSDGAPLEFQKSGLKITPVTGWEMVTDSGNLTLIMQEPEDSNVVYDKPTFRRNITVATIQNPSPIDQQRAKEFSEEMTGIFAKDGMSKDFKILEHKFFNYKGKDDGLIVYSTFRMRDEFDMMQMHILISGEEKQFLMTYTDLAERFSEEAMFNKAWQSMVSAEVQGIAPKRYAGFIKYGALGGIFFMSVAVFGFVRSRKARRGYMVDANESIYNEDATWDEEKSVPVTQTGVWRLDGAEADLEEEMVSRFGSNSSGNNKQQMSFVSNY